MLEMRDKNTENKEQNDRSKLFFISNYFKCKWIELPSKKAGIGKMDWKDSMIQLYAIRKRLSLHLKVQVSW